MSNQHVKNLIEIQKLVIAGEEKMYRIDENLSIIKEKALQKTEAKKEVRKYWEHPTTYG
jgi:predicted  nucleic acid-binding Zn-ribbon protein